MGVFDIEKQFYELIEEARHAIDNLEFDLKRHSLKVQPDGDYSKYESLLDDLNEAVKIVIEVDEGTQEN